MSDLLSYLPPQIPLRALLKAWCSWVSHVSPPVQDHLGSSPIYSLPKSAVELQLPASPTPSKQDEEAQMSISFFFLSLT